MLEQQPFGFVTTLTDNNQFVLPKNIRHDYGILPGSKIIFLNFRELSNSQDEVELVFTIKINKNNR